MPQHFDIYRRYSFSAWCSQQYTVHALVTVSINSGSTSYMATATLTQFSELHIPATACAMYCQWQEGVKSKFLSTIAEITKFNAQHVQLNFVASAKVTLKSGVYYFLSWTGSAWNQMFAASQNQLLSWLWWGLGVLMIRNRWICIELFTK
jgi:hypothetical protein